MEPLYSTKCVKSPIYRHDYASDERRSGRREKPHDCTNQVLGVTEPTHRRMFNDCLTTRCQASGCVVGEQEAILLGQEKPWCNGVDAYVW